MDRFRLQHALRISMWFLPLLCVLAGVALSFATLAIDRAADYDLIPRSLSGSPAAAESMLGTVTASVTTLAGLVISFTLVAIQLAMGQFSPRIVRSLLHDRGIQVAIGLFGATFVHALLVMRAVDEDSGHVPGLSVVVALALMLASVAALLFFVHHAGQTLRASGLIDLVGDNLRAVIEEDYPALPDPGGMRDGVIAAREPGTIIRIGTEQLVDAARAADCRLELLPRMGDFVPVGAPLLRVHGDAARLDPAHAARQVVVASERTHEWDPAYGFRKLVDIAERSIAQPFTDPTTAVQAIDRIHDCLRQLAPREFPSGEFRDADGVVRFVLRRIEWEGYVRLAFDELRLAGAGSPQVTRRIAAALEDLKTVAPPRRRPALDHQLALLRDAVQDEFQDDGDVRAAMVPDAQGIGSGEDLSAAREPS